MVSYNCPLDTSLPPRPSPSRAPRTWPGTAARGTRSVSLRYIDPIHRYDMRRCAATQAPQSVRSVAHRAQLAERCGSPRSIPWRFLAWDARRRRPRQLVLRVGLQAVAPRARPRGVNGLLPSLDEVKGPFDTAQPYTWIRCTPTSLRTLRTAGRTRLGGVRGGRPPLLCPPSRRRWRC